MTREDFSHTLSEQGLRHATLDDLNNLATIEAASYPKAEGASYDSIHDRLVVFSDYFWLLEDNEAVLAFINGMAINQTDLTDDMYDDANLHNPAGDWFMIFSVVTNPDFRGKGYASQVMTRVIQDIKSQGKKGIVLTCKEHLLGFYGKFGFINEGISSSEHGGVAWYQMRLTF